MASDNMSDELKLVEPSVEWTGEMRDFIAAFRAEGRSHIPGLLPDSLLDDPETLIKRNCEFSRGENLPQGWVPASTWYAVQDRALIGVINLRHRLVPALEKLGGHIGYSVHPRYHNKGYGTRMLALL